MSYFLPPVVSPVAGDVVDLIVNDHRQVEALFNALEIGAGAPGVLVAQLATMLIAHSDAEEAQVYPFIRAAAAAAGQGVVGQKPDAETQHTSALVHLLQLMQAPVYSIQWTMALQALKAGVLTHAQEEELTLLTEARMYMPIQQRLQIGAAFAAMKAQKIAMRCGNIYNVRMLVGQRAGL